MRRTAAGILLVVAPILGGLITYIDSRPTWDSTGITAGTLLLVCACFGLIHPKRAWIWALAVGGGIPLLALVQHHDATALLILLIPLAGAYGGAITRRILAPPLTSTSCQIARHSV